jgi:hypothetical protein
VDWEEFEEGALASAWERIQAESPRYNQLRRRVSGALGDGWESCLYCGGELLVRKGRGRRYQLCGVECARVWELRRRRVRTLEGVRRAAGQG